MAKEARGDNKIGAAMRRTGIDVIGDVCWGTHFCQFYETSQDLIDTLVPYFREGLKANEFCMWVTSEPLKVDQATAALRAAVPDLDDYINKGQIEILDYSQWYTRSGKFSSDEVLKGWVDKLAEAQKRGFEGLRLTGNTFWLEQADWNDFTRYEETVNNVIGRYKMLAICTYSLQKCNALEILDVIANHQFALIKRSGRWDIIESAHHKKVEQALRESEERYSTTLASIGDAVIAADVVGNITFMNAVAEELTGWSIREALQKPAKEVFNIVNEYTRREVEDPVTKVLEKGAVVGLANHTILVKRDGNEVPIDDSGAPIRDRNGNTMGVVLVFRNIAERKRMEEELARLASFPKLNPNPIVEVDLQGHVYFLNPAAQKLFPDLQEMGCDHPWLADWGSVAQAFCESKTDTYIRDVSIGDKWYQQSMYFMPDAQHVRIYGLDITKRKKIEEELRNSERLYRAIGESIDYGVWVCAPDGRNIYASESFLKLVGITQEKCSNFGWGDVLHPDDSERTIAAWKECVRTGGTWDIEHRFRGVDGMWHPILARGVPVRNEQGQIICWAGINLDISQLKQAEEKLLRAKDELEQRVQERTAELQDAKENLEVINEELHVEIDEHEKTEKELLRAKEEAEEAVKAKSLFLANMSHELRTPMNSVIRFTGLLLDEPLAPEQKDYLESIRNSGNALLTLINDLLDFSRMEREDVEMEDQPFDLRSCIEEALDLVTAEASKKNLDLAYSIDKDMPEAIIGDPARLRQVLVNLLGNAVKYTDEGEIVLSVLPKGQDEILFEIRDTGIGIPEEKMNILCQPFSRVDESFSSRSEGAGLGLAISKKLVEMMGGRIWVESAPGQGSTFSFTIKAIAVSGKPKAIPTGIQPKLEGKTVLIVDDNKTNRIILGKQLHNWGIIPVTKPSGQEALALIRGGAPFDAAILDMMMPDMDGVALAKEIRKYRKDLPLILLSSVGQRGKPELFEAVLNKPIKPAQLHKVLSDTLAVQQSRDEAESLAGQASRSPMRILLAEDNVSNQRVTLEMLRKLGYRADAVANGAEAVQALERQPYDLIFMDIKMPVLGGIEATRMIRERWPNNGPKIIAITAYALHGDKEKCLAAGMDGYIPKPVQKEDLADVLEKYSQRAL